MIISGRTRLAGIIGMPVAHSLSPVMHNAAYAALGLDWAYVPLGLDSEDDLARVLPALRVLPFVGFNVTMPFKQAMLEHCDEVAMLAQMAGAVNTVHCVDGRLIGYNTDGRGIVESLKQEAGFSAQDQNIVILGAGGAAGAAALSFILEKPKGVSIVNRTIERAEELADRVRPCARAIEVVAVEPQDAEEAVRSAKLVVNATSLGMRPDDPSPVPAEWLNPEQIVCDMVYCAKETPLLRAARGAGAIPVGGLGMLVHQAALAIDIWNEASQQQAPRDVMRAAAEVASEGRCEVAE